METTRHRPAPGAAAAAGRRDGQLLWLSRALFVITIVLLLSGMALRAVAADLVAGEPPEASPYILAANVLANSVVGVLIVSRYPRQVVGWLLLILGFSYSANATGYLFWVLGDAKLLNLAEPFLRALLGMGGWLFIFQPIIQQIFIPLYFPDGRLLTRRWRIVALSGALIALLSFLSFAIDPGLTTAPAAAADASPARSVASFLYFGVVQPVGFLTLGAVVLSVILRYRRSGPTQRAQMKWVLYILVLSIAVQNLLWAFNTLTGRETAGARTLINVVTLLFAIALPVVIGIAIARFRLYEIDLIIRRTLIYATLTGALALVYLGSVVLLQSLLGLVVASESPLVLVTSTLLIAALFNPLRRRIQDVIDRRFYRRKYDARATVREFAASLQAETDLQRMVDQLLAVAEETMQPESVAVWLVEELPPSRKLGSFLEGAERRLPPKYTTPHPHQNTTFDH